MAMITAEYLTQIEEAMNDDTFAAKIVDQTSVEEVKALFADKDIELDDEIAKAVISKLDSYKECDELTVEDLELVSGGGTFGTIISTIIGCTVGAALVALGPVAAIGIGSSIAIYGIIKTSSPCKSSKARR